MTPLIPVIMCGGVGSRLWPVSRKAHPKPFIKLDDGESLLQKAYKRAALLKNTPEILTVTNKDLHFSMQEEYDLITSSSLNVRNNIETSFILEPVGRNTAPAIAAACIKVLEKYKTDVTLLMLAADHLIENQANFSQAVDEAFKLAQTGKIVTFGIFPNSPETGYGYIEYKENEVINFVEKPNSIKAQEFVDSKKYLWNSGMLCFSAKTMLNELEKHCPDILEETKNCLNKSVANHDYTQSPLHLDNESFSKITSESIDYAVLEKTLNSAVVPCEIGWSDIGCWKSLGDLTSADGDNNRFSGNVISNNSNNCSVRSENNTTIGLVGVDNLVVVNTPDALLVASKDNVQEVKSIYQTLLNKKHETHEFHTTVQRPWGTYTILEESQFFKVKRIEVKPEAKLSLQMHNHRSEHWVIVKGSALVTNGEKNIQLNENESTFIPAKNKHCLENNTDEPIVMIEVQTGSYLGEDDIVRFQDIYGRV